MKQAVVLIHGVGEQVPMDTLRGFVDAVWTSDPSLRRPNVPAHPWSKPDTISGDFELRRLTTAENREGRRTDFFEFYWAHLMVGTEVGHLLAWARVLLFRSPARVPRQLRSVWFLLVVTTVAVVAGIAAFFLFADSVPGWWKTLLSGVGTLLWITVGGFIVKKVAGDAARYLHVAPPNIESRRRIREAGVKLLRTLHARGEYDRIIVAGHSLGSVIGYDILTHTWARCHDRLSSQPRLDALRELEEMARHPDGTPEFVRRYQAAQRRYFDELKDGGHPWLVTDFVTMGSPLAHAVLLLARSEQEFADRKQQREFPTCPPTLEEITVAPYTKERKFTFRSEKLWLPHHAAVFAPTCWTNLYFPCRAILWGDVIGGPVAPAFGPGIRDVPVKTSLRGGLFTHTFYWRFPPHRGATIPPWIESLQQALNLCLTPAPSIQLHLPPDDDPPS